jgi:putative endonuclease
MAWVYIVECSDGSYYVGSTVDLERRVSEHNLGLGAAYTKHRRPVRLVWAEEHFRVEDAYVVEKRLQGWSRRKREALISGNPATLPGLSSQSWAAMRERDG